MEADLRDILLDGADDIQNLLEESLRETPKEPDSPKPKRKAKAKAKAGSEGGVVEWGGVKGRVRSDDVNEWKDSDFYIYISEGFRNLVGVGLALSKTAGAIAVQHIRKRIKDASGEACDKNRLRDYIDWFFNEHAPKEVSAKNGQFEIGMLKWPALVQSYCLLLPTPVVPPKPQAKKQSKKIAESEVKSESDVTKAGVSEMAELGMQALLLKYGVVIAVNWVDREGYPALSIAEDAIGQAVKSDRRFWKNVVDATERCGPYPTYLWTDVNALVERVRQTAKVKLEGIELKTCDENKSLVFLKNT